MKPEEYFKLQQIEFQNTKVETWVLRNKHFLYSPLERILKGFWDTQKQQTVQSTALACTRALVCTSAYSNLIKRATERFFILKFGKLTQYFCMKSNFWTVKTVSILVKVCIYMLYTRRCQGYCLMGAWSPQAPIIYLWATKILIKESEWGHKNHDALADFH